MTTEKQRYELLDGLRGIAMAAVMIEHFGGLPIKYFGFGYFGVDLFFVLSGFLITGILLKCRGKSFGENLWVFTGRRAMRIFPLYYALLAVLFLLNYRGVRTNIVPLATYTWNYYCIGADPFYLWSLSVEEQFYLFWPIVILALRGSRRYMLAVVVLLTAASYYQLLYGTVEWLSKFNYTGLPNRMGSLCVGAIAAILVADGKDRFGYLKKSRLLEILSLIAILLSGMSMRSESGIVSSFRAAYPVMALGSVILIVKCATRNGCSGLLTKLLSQRFLVQFGRLSYAIYLVHVPLGEWLRNTIIGPLWHQIPFEALGPFSFLRWQSWLLVLPSVTISSFLLSMASWHLLERPLSDLKERWFRSA